VPGAAGASFDLPDAEAHHVARVLRVGVGNTLIVFDGRGGEWLTRIRSASKGRVSVDVVEERSPIAEPPVAVTLGVALLKGDQMSDVVRDATATGVRAIQPFVSDHVALPAEAWRTRARERWLRVASSAAAQCGRAVVPEIGDVCRFEALLDSEAGERLICIEPSAAVGDRLDSGRAPATAVVLIGPEGGWSASEITRALGAGFQPLDLGPRTLRAELAPAVALATLWERWGS